MFFFRYLFNNETIKSIGTSDEYILIDKSEYIELKGYNNLFNKVKSIFEDKGSRFFFLNNYLNVSNQEMQENEAEIAETLDDDETIETIETNETNETETNHESTSNDNNEDSNDITKNENNQEIKITEREIDTISTISSNEYINSENDNDDNIKDKVNKLQTVKKVRLSKIEYNTLIDRKKFIKEILHMDNIYNFIMYKHDPENKEQIINNEMELIENNEEFAIAYFEKIFNTLHDNMSILDKNITRVNRKINNITIMIIISVFTYWIVHL